MSSESDSWVLSENQINESGSVSNTFSSVFDNIHEEFVFGMYNDEKPVNKSLLTQEWWGHMKGLFAFKENDTGFWLIHSVPKLSNRTDKFEFPATAEHYGQHFLCVTLAYNTLYDIAEQLLIARPLIQAFKLSESVAQSIPALQYVMHHSVDHILAPFRIVDLQTNGRTLKLRHFSKSKDFNYDLYQTLVAPSLNRSLIVETWRHAKDDIPSNCSDALQIRNALSLDWAPPINVSFTVYEDHSKWAITDLNSSDPEGSWTCLGDINHAASQFHRGGGTMCLNTPSILYQFRKIVTVVENCTSPLSYQQNQMDWLPLIKANFNNSSLTS